MTIPTLENKRVKLTLLDFNNYTKLEAIAQEKDLIFYSPSDISTSKKLKTYVTVALKGHQHKSTIPFIIYDKKNKPTLALRDLD